MKIYLDNCCFNRPFDDQNHEDKKGADAERFISLILREPFDYTKWQEHLWNDRSVEDISKAAMSYRTSTDHPQ